MCTYILVDNGSSKKPTYYWHGPNSRVTLF